MPRPTARPRVVAGLRLLQQVGEGGEGEVWEARDRSGRRRALKLIRPDALVHPEEVERRGRWLLGIDHPALVTVHRCGVLAGGGLDGWGFVDMAFVDGQPMEDAPADPDALARLEPLAEALDLLHAGRWSDGVPLVHRDVKPANLIEGDDGELVLVDASTLREVDDGARTRVGTPLYAAPEVVTGRAGPLADVYSFAATAVALLTGARRGDLAELLESPHRLDIPDGLRAALAPDPVDRPVACRAALDPGLPLIVGSEVGWAQPTETAVGHDGDGSAPTLARTRHLPPDDVPWLPSATEVLLDPWHDPFEEAARAPTGLVYGWLAALALLASVLLAAGLAPLAEEQRLGLLVGVGAVHVTACLFARRRLSETLFLPPLAWAGLLADRAAPPGPARAWTRTGLAACTTLPVVLAVGLAAGPDLLDPGTAVTLAVLGLGAAAAMVAAAPRGRLARLALAPVWLLGAGLLLGGGVALLPLAALAGRARGVARFLGATLGSAAAFVRTR